MSANSTDTAADAVAETPARTATPQQGRRLALLGAAGIAGLAAYRVNTSDLDDPLLIGLGVLMITLAAIPAILWARRGDIQLPAFEVLMLTGIPFYAFPLFDQHPAIARYSDDVIFRAAMEVVMFQAAALVAYFGLRGRAGRSAIWRESLLPESYLRFTGLGLALTTAYQVVSQYTDLIPWEINSVLRALFYGIGMLSAFIQMQRWGAGQLSGSAKLFVGSNLLAQIILHFAGLYLITGASLLLLVLISYTSASRRVPVITVIAAVAVLGVLHNGKSHMRAIYWEPDSPKVGIADLPAFFSEWVSHSMEATQDRRETVTSRLLERTSLFHILCVAVDFIPTRQPHLDGESYEHIPAQFVPRLLWPDKPGPHKSNTRLAVYLGFVPDEEAARNVSIAFGTPSEAYVNFGTLGVLLLGAFYGVLFKKFATLTHRSPPLSVGGLSMVLLLAWSLQAEMTLSVWVSSLYQAAVVLIGIPVVFRVLFGR